MRNPEGIPADITQAYTVALRGVLEHLGVDPHSEGLEDTPARVLRAMTEMTAGYAQDPADILSRTFEVPHPDEMIIVRGVPFESLCEHHLLPFAGTACIAYLPAPGARVVGLSKLPRLLECFTRRLQTQERITVQVTTAITKHLSPLGAACILRATHGCMAHRGVRRTGEMVTSSLTGIFRDDAQARAELLALVRA